MICPEHPEIELPHMMTCPLCAQEARRRAYEVQQVAAAKKLKLALLRLPIAAAEASEDTL